MNNRLCTNFAQFHCIFFLSNTVLTFHCFTSSLQCPQQSVWRCCIWHLIKLIIFYKIFWIVRAFSLVYKCVLIVLWSTKMTSAIWLTVSELCEFTVRASYIVFLFVKTENNNFIKEIRHVVRAFVACWKPRQSLGEFSTASRCFTDLFSNSPNLSPRFSLDYEGTENMFYFLNQLLLIT